MQLHSHIKLSCQCNFILHLIYILLQAELAQIILTNTDRLSFHNLVKLVIECTTILLNSEIQQLYEIQYFGTFCYYLRFTRYEKHAFHTNKLQLMITSTHVNN